MRNKIARIVLLPAFLAACLATPALADKPSAADRASERGEAELAELLEGRVAGKPVRCLRTHQRDNLTVIEDTAFVFRDGDTLYVNRPDGARFLSDWDVPVFEPFGTGLCRLDRVEMRDRSTLMRGPVLVLSDFVPYRRTDDTQASEGG